MEPVGALVWYCSVGMICFKSELASLVQYEQCRRNLLLKTSNPRPQLHLMLHVPRFYVGRRRKETSRNKLGATGAWGHQAFGGSICIAVNEEEMIEITLLGHCLKL